ncbi:MAG: hypothetical protein GY830_09435 [Bacteroidetes bacterium]|nr:hypothetical protein [Bacteroidota bacterium]
MYFILFFFSIFGCHYNKSNLQNRTNQKISLLINDSNQTDHQYLLEKEKDKDKNTFNFKKIEFSDSEDYSLVLNIKENVGDYIEEFLNHIYDQNNSDLEFNYDIIKYDPNNSEHNKRYWPLSELDRKDFEKKLNILINTTRIFYNIFVDNNIHNIDKISLYKIFKKANLQIHDSIINLIIDYKGELIPFFIKGKYSIARVAYVCGLKKQAFNMFYLRWLNTGICDSLFIYDHKVRKEKDYINFFFKYFSFCQTNLKLYANFRPFYYTQWPVHNFKIFLNQYNLKDKTEKFQNNCAYCTSIFCICINCSSLLSVTSTLNCILSSISILHNSCCFLGNMYHNKFEKYIVYDYRYYPLEEVGNVTYEMTRYWKCLNCLSNIKLCSCNF